MATEIQQFAGTIIKILGTVIKKEKLLGLLLILI
jgi:hypothetical protein